MSHNTNRHLQHKGSEDVSLSPRVWRQITDSQAETLEYQVAEALQDLITRNAKNNEIEDLEGDYTAVTRGEQKAQPSRATV